MSAAAEQDNLIEQRHMLDRARAQILQGGQWLTAEQFWEQTRLPQPRIHRGVLQAYCSQGYLPAIEHEGKKRYPLFAFKQRHPQWLAATQASSPASLWYLNEHVRGIIAALRPIQDDWGIAFWFASANIWLDGARPQDRIATDSDAVLAAAHREAQQQLQPNG